MPSGDDFDEEVVNTVRDAGSRAEFGQVDGEW